MAKIIVRLPPGESTVAMYRISKQYGMAWSDTDFNSYPALEIECPDDQFSKVWEDLKERNLLPVKK